MSVHGASSRVWSATLSAACAITAALTAWVAWQTFWLTSAAISPIAAELITRIDTIAAWRPSVAAAFLLAAVIFTAVAFWFPRRRGAQGLGFLIAGGIAVVVVALGMAAYLPCASQSWTGLPGWVLLLFTGNYEAVEPGSLCSATQAPGLVLARTLALSVTVLGFLSVAAILARDRLARLGASRSSDVDVVVGLSDLTLPLVAVLARDRRPPATDRFWSDRGPRLRGSVALVPPRKGTAVADLGTVEDVSRWQRALWRVGGIRKGDLTRAGWRRRWRRATKVVVIDIDPQNALASAVRAAGAVYVAGDATDQSLLRSVITSRTGWRRRRRVAIRRLYAVTVDQRLNLEVWKQAKWILQEKSPSGMPIIGPHPADVMPRIVVRMDDEREAVQWREEKFGQDATEVRGSIALLSDAVTLDGMIAQSVVREVVPPTEWLLEHFTVRELLLVGESSVALAILDELAWQLWCRAEVAEAAGIDRAEARPRLATVTLAGPKALERKSEWDQLHAPWRSPWESSPASDDATVGFTVTATSEVDWEGAAKRALARDGGFVVFVEDLPEYAAAASRLSRMASATAGKVDGGGSRGRHRVVSVVRSVATTGEPVVVGGLVRVFPSLVRKPLEKWPQVPIDFATRLARQQHNVWRAPKLRARGLASDAWPGGANSQSHIGADGITDRIWGKLPGFFREDNTRQQWTILDRFSRRGFRRGPGRVMDGAIDRETLFEDAARVEHDRWCRLRKEHGWWRVDVGVADKTARDERRLHHLIRAWDDLEPEDREYNVGLVKKVAKRLGAVGLMQDPDDLWTQGASESTSTSEGSVQSGVTADS